MKLTDIIIAVVALILAYFLIRILSAITFFVIKMAVILIIAAPCQSISLFSKRDFRIINYSYPHNIW